LARARRLRVGIDIGGTFTDFLLSDDDAGRHWFGKTLTTADPAEAVLTGLREVLHASAAEGSELATVVHGTTLVTNAILERKGDVTALVTTRGFRDAVEIAREHRYDMYDIFLDLPAPIAPRRLRYEVDERVLADGSVLTPLDEAGLREVAGRARAAGVRALAVSFLHSYREPAHEVLAEAVLRQALPGVEISISSDVAGEIREYERTSTTLVNVYVRRLVAEYLDVIQEHLAAAGSRARLLVMLSSGSVATVDVARRYPVRMIESGPAAGALAAAHLGLHAGRPNLLSFDMGGTTAKACVIEGGRPLVTTDFEVDRVYRFKKGSGLPVKAPTIELIEIGAGGGSIAGVDRFGLVRVGPESAGAHPGPACYGQGGRAPTVTDADLVLGYLNPDYFLGGRMRLDRVAAERALEEAVAGPLGLSMAEAAWSVHQVVNENMAGAARIHAVERGKDARAFPLFAFGGAGPVHAFHVARLLGSRELLVPAAAGVGSTIGFLVAPLAADLVRSGYALLDEVDWHGVEALFSDMEEEGRALLASAGVPVEDVRFERSADMRLAGQAHQTLVALPAWRAGESPVAAFGAAFRDAYESLYGRTPPGVAVEVFNWRLLATAPRPELRLRPLEAGTGVAPVPKGERPVYWREHADFVPTPVYERSELAVGTRLGGPVVIEERESTTIVGPAGSLEVDGELNLVVSLGD
jgi:N-methylhydantoinase A